MQATATKIPRWRVATAALLAALGVLSAAPSAHAEQSWWHVVTQAAPTNLKPGTTGQLLLTVENLGDESASEGVTIRDALPHRLKALAIAGVAHGGVAPGEDELKCELTTMTCEGLTSNPPHSVIKFPPYTTTQITIEVEVEAGANEHVENTVTVAGGGSPPVSVSQPISIDATPAGIGIAQYELTPFNEDGSVDTQAGSHPFELTTTLGFNLELPVVKGEFRPSPVGFAKQLQFELPRGFVGNTLAVPRCTLQQFTATKNENGQELQGPNLCPADSAIGAAAAYFEVHTAGNVGIPTYETVPIYNLSPARGEPARFGIALVAGHYVYLDTSVRTGAGYGLVVSVNNITQDVGFNGGTFTFWGTPAAAVHNNARGWNCLNEGRGPLPGEHCVESSTGTPSAFLTLPASCPEEPFSSTVTVNSWDPKVPPISQLSILRDSHGLERAVEGCNRLKFAPTLSVSPDGTAASTPTGLSVGIHVPQTETLNPAGLAQANVRSTTVTLPEGVQLSPSAGDGLFGCSTEQIGFKGVNPVSGEDEFTDAPPSCPDASKIGTVKIKTPLLANPLEGELYLAAPQNFAGGALENPFRTLIAAYIVAEDPVSGVLVKLPGKVTPDATTGQVTATFESPQLPFEDAEFKFFGGSRAPLTTPASCGSYTTTASITPWSGSAAAEPSSTFDINSGPNGAACSSPQPFAPGFQAGTTNLQAGAFTPFTLTMSRPDGDQALAGVSMHMPPGLLGMISSVKLCEEPQASQGTCGPESLIGETIVSAGLGPDPYTVTGGKVYITTGYKGAPYGLSIVNPAKAGPFILDEGRPVIVRAAINVDPRTAQLTVTSDPLPTILDGIPLQIQHVNVTISRAGFTFNPTNCNPLGITGVLTSQEGATAPVGSPFQITNCATLAYKPSLSVATGARTSRANGASLHFKIAYPKGAMGSESWFKEAKFDLPKQLPARLTTIQKACLAATFENDRGACPPASRIGTASVSTPVLANPLKGSVYFVSYGGAKFPDAVIALEGEGIKIDLHGETFINGKTGITSATFRDLPDVPFNSIEVTVPTGRYSEFAANLPAKAHGSFCGQKLVMPTKLAAQNGLEIHQNTPITITGCPKAHKAKKASKKHGKRHNRG